VLADEGIQILSRRLREPNTEFNPLLRRLKALLVQWELKPGLVEADLVLEQFIANDEENTRRAYSLVHTFVWALPVLGLIGTVLGIAFAVGGFANFLGGNVDDVGVIKKSLVGVTGGLSFAFLLTLLGLVTSLMLMLLASGLETREERLHQSTQQYIVANFLPELQRICPTEDGGKAKADLLGTPLKAVGEAVLGHVATIAETYIARLSGLLEDQQKHVVAWGSGLRLEASSAAVIVKASLEDAAKSLRGSEREFLERLDLVQQTWKQQADFLRLELQSHTKGNQAIATQLQAAAQDQVQASQSLAATLETMQSALTANAATVKSLEAGVRQLAESPLEKIATALVDSLKKVELESERVAATLSNLTTNTRLTAETQVRVHDAVKSLHDLKLVETLGSFRDALTRHANLVDKLNSGLKITLISKQ
jgi:biopolymer transport protein ExbB/TolQ